MKVLCVAPTQLEVSTLIQDCIQDAKNPRIWHGSFNNILCDILITGVGLIATGIQLTKQLAQDEYNYCIHLGIAGTYDPIRFPVGTVVEVIIEQMSLYGIEEADGSFREISNTGLLQPDDFYSAGSLQNQSGNSNNGYPKAKGMSVMMVTGTKARRDHLYALYEPDVETMEGVAFFESCLTHSIPFMSLKGISNVVGPRDKDSWQIEKAVQELGWAFRAILKSFTD